MKTIDSEAIVSAIINVHNGNHILDPMVVGKIFNEIKKESIADPRFPAHEVQILELISIGKTNKEISLQLYLAEKTVRNYVSKLMKKVSVNNRTELALFWTKEKSQK